MKQKEIPPFEQWPFKVPDIKKEVAKAEALTQSLREAKSEEEALKIVKRFFKESDRLGEIFQMIEVRFTCGHIFSETIPVGSTEDFENIDAESTTVRKVLKDGQIYILRGNTMYSIEGLKIED